MTIITLQPRQKTRQAVTAGDDDTPTVLIVEDEQHLADLYTDYLSDQYHVQTAYSGEEGLELLSPDIDVVLLDRRMPVVSGNEVLAQIEEKGLRCRVAMVTAIDPDFDIIEMRVDDYLVKPVTRDDLQAVVNRLYKIREYNDRLRTLTSKKLKRNVLRVEKTERELQDSARYQELQNEIERISSNVESLADELDVEKSDLQL
ncbi:DNA-binding response regulator [Haloarcula sp. CBA1130]|uniref:response regulator transcription factor n=1 Tax=unclassified Haloarcula TaxID=2624677 RepID=UPI001246F967|nr:MULTISPECIES: response regulator [unclassified Haloarcula]KAA9397026.1 DNA-binding response regulator [Haloarcula sp. CBA1129]KAA9402936.1 DNA-binding response regulator [Haloarcula sp. CBA1130]